jgi:hypothetical protein
VVKVWGLHDEFAGSPTVGRIDWKNGIFGRCVTARGRTGQLRHRGKRFALQFGLELAFADMTLLPSLAANLKLGDHNDLVVVGSALNSKAEILVTGDQEMLELEEKPKALRILSPRGFWNLEAGKEKSKG